jgi:hypothetical protein
MSSGSRFASLPYRHDPARFNRACAVLALLFLTFTIVGKLLWRWDNQDFPQYYMGGVMARLGEFDSLYPIPKPGGLRNPGFFEDSDLKPRYAQEADFRGVGQQQVRYMQPPPFALLLVPLSFLTYKQGYIVWTIAMMLCAWWVALLAGAVYRACLGRMTHGAGILTLLIAISPSAHRWVRVQNMSALMGVLIGITVLGLLNRKSLRSALAMWLGGLAKYATGVFLPLLLVMRQWRALILLIAISAASVLLSLWIMGRGPFEEYLGKIAPTLKNTNTLVANQAIQGFVARAIHGTAETQRTEDLPQKLAGRPLIPPGVKTAITAAQALVILLILGLMFSYWRSGARFWIDHPPMVFAAATALMCWLLIFSPMYWEHYTAYLAPLFGWAAWEATRSRARLVLVILAGAMLYAPLAVMFKRLPDPWAAHILWGTCLLLGLAIARLWKGPDVDSPSVAERGN